MSSVPEIRIYSPSGSCQDGDYSIHSSVVGSTSSRMIHLMNKDYNITYRDTMTAPQYHSIDNFNVDVNHNNATVLCDNKFHLRLSNLANFPSSTTTYRTTYRSQAMAMQRAKIGCITSSLKSLDILRQNLQRSINKELDEVIQKYLEKFFKPAIENIRCNNGSNAVAEEHIRAVCRQVLEEAKKLYDLSITRGSSPAGDYSDSETYSQHESRLGSSLRLLNKVPFRRRKESDTDSEASQNVKPKRKKGRPPLHINNSGRSTPSKSSEPIRREGPKWDPSRLTSDTLFVMGARANKALGLGATRGRLYIKHPELFKYSGDQDDKQWLYDHNLMPATGGKAYMLLVDDINDLAETDEYKNSSGLMLDAIVSFTVPEFMLDKMRSYVKSVKTDTLVVTTTTTTTSQRKRGRPPGSLNKSSLEISLKQESNQDENKKQEFESSEAMSPVDDLELLGVDGQSTTADQTSPFSNAANSYEVSPMTVPSIGISPTPSELSVALDPPLSASFDITSSP